jgi:hypothetical protein
MLCCGLTGKAIPDKTLFRAFILEETGFVNLSEPARPHYRISSVGIPMSWVNERFVIEPYENPFYDDIKDFPFNGIYHSDSKNWAPATYKPFFILSQEAYDFLKDTEGTKIHPSLIPHLYQSVFQRILAYSQEDVRRILAYSQEDVRSSFVHNKALRYHIHRYKSDPDFMFEHMTIQLKLEKAMLQVGRVFICHQECDRDNKDFLHLMYSKVLGLA